MNYISTRGQAPKKSFVEVVTSGLANDGGLYVPETIPTFDIEQIKSWKGLSYKQLAFNIIAPFVNGEIEDADLQEIINKSYAQGVFDTEQVTKIIKLKDGFYVQELFHGPTLAFKDIALQFLGKLQDHILTKQNKHIVIVGATSGDTGSAAIYGVKDCKNVKIFMLHPNNRISEIQRHQMTTVNTDNVFNIAVDSFFDDCQDMVKEMFKHPEFMKGTQLSAVNSINWARIVAQIVYYFQAVLEITGAEKPVSFSVPSGNLGDIFGGYMAKKMGLPIDKLIVSTNRNDILHRFFQSNDYSKQSVHQTVAPSMDIQISSNFERLIFLEYGLNGKVVNDKMLSFRETGKLVVNEDIYANIKKTFASATLNDDEIKQEIKAVYDEFGYVVCPHTATGTLAAKRYCDVSTPMVVMATAHPAKFPDVVEDAINVHPKLPEYLSDLLNKEEIYVNMPNNIDLIKDYIYKSSN